MITGSRNISISAISGSRNTIYPFFDVWSQKNDMLAIIYDSAHVDFWFLIINDTQIKKNHDHPETAKMHLFLDP